ncbi:hypothetical protein [Mesorhizobium sp. B2-3-2]|uniref:hypothetical protein n=1 Tax=Mesorhizobium sp. B2-3-2 TaxID=2589961 RepID=UPI00112A66AA|nr:hypothetical protein [Mesorhizobium sp. B2-3-2]TPM37066.1 hypothetical protein FJ964_30500 [Mesorhizobium sp. B2-3-2]
MDDVEALAVELVTGIETSDHGLKRMRQRRGLPKKAAEREIERAHSDGTPRTDYSGRMRRTLDALFHRHGHFGDYRVWRGWVFVFKGHSFVTVFPLTNGLQNSKAGMNR